MKKNIYTGIFCTILGLCTNTTANASIVSSGFLDEKLTEMTNATALQLDLKANQSDFTELNTQISGSVDLLRGLLARDSSNYEFVNHINPEKYPNTISGAFQLLYQYLEGLAGSTLRGWTDSESNTYLGIKGLNDKIGSYYWEPENGVYKFSNIPYFKELFPSTSPDKNLATNDMATTILSNYTDPNFPGLAGVTNRLLNGWTDENGVPANPGLKNIYGGWTDSDGNFFPGLSTYSIGEANVIKSYDDQNTARVLINGTKATTIDGVDYTGPVYPLWKLSEEVAKIDSIETKIGTLPSGNFPNFPGRELLFSELNQPLTYPTSLAELITAIYGNSETSKAGLLADIIAGFPFDTDGDGIPEPIGLIPNLQSAADANTKIGTLPTEIPNMDSTWARYGFVETTGTPIDLPDTIGGMFAMLFNEDDSYNGLSLRNIMGKILMGFNGIEGLAKLTSAYRLVGDSPIVTAVNANTAKIGTLPDGYETVGAALSAIKGIAEEAKAAALAAIPDPKTEGSNGKYVLTVDIVGDNATYRWEPIDRGDTTPTTE